MIKAEENILEKILSFIFLFFIWEMVLLLGSFIIFKLSISIVADSSLLSFIIDNFRETIKAYSFFDFITENKHYFVLTAFFSNIFTFYSLE